MYLSDASKRIESVKDNFLKYQQAWIMHMHLGDNILSASHISPSSNGLLLFLNLGFPFGEILRRNKCTKWRNMGKCFHPREDIKASKRIRVLNSLFVSQIIHKTG